MPKYIVNGKTYNIPDNKVDGFENKYPDAEVEYYNEGKKYLIPIGKRDGFLKKFPNASYDGNSEIVNTSQQPASTLKSTELFNVIPVKDSTAERDETYSITNPPQSASAKQPYAEHRVPTYGEGEYATGFGQGFKQGWKGLKEGVKYFVGETANLISGSSQDDAGALKRFDELQQSGQELQQPLLSRKDRRYHKQMSGAESVTVPMEFQYDEKGMPIPGTGRVLTEEEKQKHRDILQNDEYNQLISDAITAAGGDLSQARRILAARAEDKTWGDRLMESASEEMAKIKPTKGMGAWVGNLIPQMIPAASSMMLSVVTKNPKYLKYIGGLGIGTMSVSTAGQSMKEARDAGADNAQVWAVGLTNAAIDYATEKIPFDRYTTRLFNGTKKNVAQELSEAVADNTSPARAELEKLLIAANKKLGGRLLNGKNVKDFAGDILAEGTSEFTAEALQTITPMIYENPEDYPTISEIINNGWEGAKAGLFMGSVLGGASKTLEHRQNRSRRKQQGYIDVVQVATNQDGISDIGEVIGVKDNGNLSVLIDGSVEEVAPHKVQERHKFTFDEFDKAELQMEMDESYDNGYSLSTPQEMNDAQNTYDLQREKALSLFYEEVLDKIEADPIMYLDAYSGEHRDVLLDYINAKQVRDGMIQRVRDDIDSRIEESNTMVDSRTNTDTGMIQGATMKVDDRKVYVVKGNLVQYDDKSGINNSASSESVIIRDAQTGKIEIVSPDAILNIDDAIDPNEEKATAAEVIRTTYARAEADKMEGKLTFNPGDTYTLDTENGQMQVQITANEQGIVDNGDGTINVTDGQNIFPVTKQTFQDQVDAANKARVAQYDALRQAERSMGNTPEYALNDKVVLRDANGNTINGQIAEVFADDGYYIVDVDVPINGSYAARMTRDELNNLLVEHNGVNVNTPSVPVQQVQSTPVAPTPSQQAQTPAAQQNNTALSRIPKDAQGNPIYEQTDADTAWDAIVEQTEGDEAMAQSVAESMLKDKQTALSKAEKMQVKGGATIAEKIAAEKERKAIIDNAQREVELWQQIAGTVQRRQAAAEVQRKIEEEKRRIAEEAAAQQAKVEEEQSQVQTNQEELAVEYSEQEVADVAPESEEKIDDSTITEQETPVQAEEQIQSEESPAESQVTEEAETPTPAQPKESKNAKKLRKRAEKWMKDTGVTVRLLHSIDEVTNNAARKAINAGEKVTGWFDGNEVVLYLPNIGNEKEIDNTFVHEVVAHKGLKALMGNDFDALCDKVWEMMSEEQRAYYIDYPGVNGDTRKAADEYMAHLAEGVDLTDADKTVWQRIVEAVRKFLVKLGMKMTDKDIENIIKASYSNLREQSADSVERLRENVGNVDAEKGDVQFAVQHVLKGNKREQAIKDLMAVTGRSRRTVEQWLKAEESLASVILNEDNLAILDLEADESVPSIWKNSDYPQGTVEFSNICKKRLPFTTIYQRLQKEFPNTLFDAQTLNTIRNTMKEKGEDVACALCFVEDRRQLLGEIGQGFIDAVKGMDVELNDNQKTAMEKLKESGDKYVPNLFDIITLDGMKELRKKHPAVAQAFIEYNNARGMQAGRLFQAYSAYNREILKYNRKKVEGINNNGGLRIFSFSDFEAHHLIDLVQVLTDCAAKGIKVQGYTKVPEFAKAVKDTNAKINRSLIPKGVGYVDADYVPKEGEAVSPNVINGKRLLFDTVEGIDVNNPNFFDSTNSKSVGNILVAINDEHARLAMADPFVDYIIGFHTGQSKAILKGKGIDTWVNYKNEQLDKEIVTDKNDNQKMKNAPKHGLNIYTDVLNVAEAEGNPIKTAKQFTERFIEECNKRGWIPRFHRFLNRAKDGRFLYTPGYHKFLIDFKLFDKNGKILPQEAVVPVFDNEFNKQILDEYVKGVKEEMPNDAVYEAVKKAVGLGEGTRFRMTNAEKEVANVVIKDTEGQKLPTNREEAFEYIPAKGVSFPNLDQKINVKVSRKSVKHTSLHNNKDTFAIFAAMREVIGNAVKIGSIPVAQDEIGHTHSVNIFYVPINVNGRQYSARLVVKELENKGVVLDELSLYNVSMHKEKDSVVQPLNASEEVGGITTEPKSVYKIKDLIHNSQELDKEIVGISGRTRFRVTPEYKQHQMDIINATNPAPESNYTWIRSVEDIKSFEEALDDSDYADYKGQDFDPSYTWDMAEDALNTGKVTVYSSYPIKNGVFVTPSYMEAQSYGGTTPYMAKVNLEDVAWIDPTQGQLATDNKVSSKKAPSDIRFRVANQNQEIFVSNARKAVESIKQEKATPEQWLAMLQKNGGLKAGEDKWMGLSDWLKGNKSKTLSKEDVLDFVNENAIKIEEVKYALEPINSLRDSLTNNKGEDFANEFIRSFGVEDSMLVMNDVQGSIDLYNNDNNANIQLDKNGEWKTENDEDVIFEWAHNVLFNADNNTSVSHKTRTYYVTKGLENNREIALVVPTIESWNNGDEIHFGDAGDGRAIAWIRFGQTTDEEGNHVLVIDEIQSKRHQEGRDKGYRPNTEIYLKKNGIEVKESDEFYEFYKNGELDKRFAKDILKNIKKAKDLYVSGLSQTDVPDAPFEKNWYELAFKRMLRLAAEEGFDKVAWATGDQQAQRYSLSNNEGMKSFYDKMIPSFVSKYTKKWGAKVGEVTMPNLEENNTMWSVDITPEMQESVMEGQTMFRISEEEQQIIDNAKANGTYLKAPNGKATKLTPKQWVQVRTKAFKKWFGDWIEDSANASKIIDENGEPMVVYHDTNSTIFRNVETGEIWNELDWKAKEEWKARDDWDEYWQEEDFYKFDNKKGRRSSEMPAFFFTPNYDEYHEYGDRNIAAFLNIRNPKFDPNIKDVGVTDTAGEDAMNNLIEEGYDGFIRTEDGQWYETNAFFPNQIKSATENEGTFNPEDNDIRFRISEEQDKAYIDAVEAGDMETAQAMVDSAAQAAGYNSPRLYHGTKSEFNVFNAKHNDPGSKGFFFTDSEEMASSYGKNIKQVYLRVEDPYVIEGNGRNWNNLHTDIFSVIPEIEDQIRAHEIAMRRFLENGDIKQSQYDYFRDKYYDKVDFIKDESKNSVFDIIKKYIYRWQIRNFNSKLNVDRTRDFEWLLQQLDSDVNIIFKDITDYGANITDYESIFTPHDVYVTTNPKNIKSADAVTYDDNGNVIPLSERFNEENDDIRFRIRQITDKERQTMINALSLSEGEEFYDNVFNGADQVVRENIVAIAAKNGWNFRKATEEYLGSLADNNPRFDEVKQIGLWDKVKGFFVDMLNKIGLNGFTKDSLADNDLRYILWRRFKNPKGRKDLFEKAEDIAKQYELGVGDYAVTNSNASQEEDILFRNGDPQVRERIRVRDRYERRVRSGLFQSKEAIQDSMLSLKEAMQMIAGKGKKYIEDIADYMNAYLGENRLSSVNQAEVNAFARTLFKPMLDVVARLAKTESERVKLIDYMFAKHGLERNAHMRQEALNNGDVNALNRDFAGLTALTGENNVTDAEAHAQKMVNEYERTHNTAELWDKVNAVSKSILSKSYECGLMSKEAYDKVSNMYQYYIPLRGFDEKTSVEEYAYLNNKKGAYNAAIRKAEGRTSKADDPFANLESMAESTIMAGNRNQLVKQKFYNFVQNNPSDLVSVSELWLEYDNVNDEWKPVFPDNIDINDTPQQVEQKLQAFEAKMEGLKQQYPDKYKHGKDAVNIPYRVITKSDLKEHQVVVKRNGRDIILTINGNPRLAQALNGMTNPDNDLSGAIGEVLRLGERINRILSTNYTTRNPDFIVSNFLRDMLYSNIMVWIKESPKYALKFHRNYAKLNPAYMRMLYGKYRKGTLNMNNKTEAMFYQFIMNGGETGFSNIRDMEQHKKDIAKMLKKANGKLNASQAMDLLATQFDELNRSVENCARFAAFMTSREVGRTIGRSIYDAKEISVNFNKKGSGAKFYDKEGQTKLGNVAAMTSGLGRAGFAFWNASIQGTTNFGRQLKRHPAKAFTSLATMFILGAIVAYLGNDDDKDDKNAYYNIPENVRRSNIMFRAGDSWISIPLPIEFRAMYGMGELATTILSGKEHLTGGEIAEAITAQMSQILPLDFMEGDGGLSTFVPTALKPAWEVYNNESWTGLPIFKDNDFNKNMPDWTKAYKKANKQLVDLAATLNEISGGDKYTKGAIDINPAKIEYLLNGYFGGIFSTIDKLTKTAETIAGDREYDPRSILLWNRVVKSGDERTDFRAINNEYYRVKEEVQDTKRRLNGYERDTGLGIFDYAEKIDFIYNSPEYERYEIFMDYNKDIKKLMEELKEAEDLGDKEWAKDIETELNYLKQEMLLVMEHTYDRK